MQFKGIIIIGDEMKALKYKDNDHVYCPVYLST